MLIHLQTAQKQGRLFCWQESQAHPYLRIGPLKAEILSMFPKSEVVVYHNVVGEQLLSYLRNDTNRSYYFSVAVDGRTDSNSRLSAFSYLDPSTSTESKRLFELVSRTTGLEGTRCPIHIASYPPGGHFLVHADTVSKFRISSTLNRRSLKLN